MNNNFHNDADFRALVERVLDGEASSEDLKLLNETLATDESARRCYVEMQMFDSALHDELNAGEGEGMESSAEAIEFEPQSAVDEASASKGGVSRQWAFKYYAVAAMLAAAAIMAVLLTGKDEVFEVVSVAGVQKADSFTTAKWISKGEKIELPEGAVLEFKSEDGNRFALKGPAELRVESGERLSLTRGSLWAELEGEPIRISVPNGEITDIGTILGVFVDEMAKTRLDVFDGQARMASAKNDNRKQVIAAGQSLLLKGLDWQPVLGVADMRLYATTKPKRLGVNFIQHEEEASFIQSTRPYSAMWHSVSEAHGTTQLADSPVRVTWVGAHTHGRQNNDTPEGAILDAGLTTKLWRPSEVQAAQAYGFQRVKRGAVIQFSNLSAWLKSSQAKKYRLTLFCNIEKTEDLSYTPIGIFKDAAMSESPIHEWNLESENLKTFIRSERGPGREYYIKEMEYNFTEDSFVLYFPSEVERTHVSAILLTVVE